MVVVSYSGKEINAKLVYYGAGLSGKTTNLESIYEAVPDTSRGKMVSMKTQSDRTLFFDLLPLDLGEIMGFKTRFLLYTVPGQVFYNATRKLVLKGSDAIVFVADSERGKMDENKESLANLRTNLTEYGLKIDEVPWVLQYNKRDLPDVYTVEELDAELNPGGKVPSFEAVAMDGRGVFETFRGISHMLMEKVTRELRRTPMPRSLSRPAAAVTPAPPPVVPDLLPEIEAAPKSDLPSLDPAPESLGGNILREARETDAAEAETPSGSFEYGRELDLDAVPPASNDENATPDSRAIPTAPWIDNEPLSESGSSIAFNVENAGSANGGLEPEAPAVSTTAAPESAAAAPDEITIPVRIPRGRRQIVLRIVVSQSE